MRTLISTFVLVVTLVPARAWACSPVAGACPFYGGAYLVGSTGDGDLPPTNVLVAHVYRGAGAPTVVEPPYLVAPDGAVIATEPSGIADWFRPVAELAPDTTYELWYVDEQVACDTGLRAPRLATRFTTGAGPDLEPPEAPTAGAYGPCCFDVCTSSSCCGPYTTSGRSASFAEVEGAAGYLLGDERLEGPGAQFGSWFAGTSGFGGRSYGTFSLIAVDRAGNRSPSSASLTVPACPTTPPVDGGGCISELDAGRPVDAARMDAGTGAAPPSGGCAVGRPSGLGWLPLIALWVLRRRAR